MVSLDNVETFSFPDKIQWLTLSHNIELHARRCDAEEDVHHAFFSLKIYSVYIRSSGEISSDNFNVLCKHEKFTIKRN